MGQVKFCQPTDVTWGPDGSIYVSDGYGKSHIDKYSKDVNLFFFFSSRRRHTRFDWDWSSDVCSSDLQAGHPATESFRLTERFRRRDFGHMDLEMTIDDPPAYTKPWTMNVDLALQADTELLEFICEENEIGRASCRERV